MSALPPPPLGERWKTWGEQLNKWLASTRDKLSNFTSGDSAYQDGVLMWRRTDDKVIVSYDGEWHPLGYGGGFNSGSYGAFYDTTTQSATAINTAYAISWGNTAYSNNIAIDGTDSTKINFSVGGTFLVGFSCTLHSENASSKEIYLFPRIDGTDVAGSTMIYTLDDNDHRKVISRSGVFQIEAGSYLQAMFAVDDLGLDLHGASATAFAPATPSVTITITEVTT